jgi:acyl carrier protein
MMPMSMPNRDRTTTVREAIAAVAPDVDVAGIADDADFGVEAALDSMDFLAVLEHVLRTTGVEVTELDYPLIRTIERFAAYLEQRTDTGVPGQSG